MARRWLLLPILLAAGCGEGKQAPVPEPPKPAEARPEAPKLPDGEEADGATEILVKDPTYAEQRRRDDYVQDEKLPAGSIRGLCVAAPPKGFSQAPAEAPLEISLADPREGELDYYRNLKLKARGGPWWMGDRTNRSGQFGVYGAVLSLRGVKKGRRPPMVRPSYLVKTGRITTSWGSYPWGPFAFCPPGERANLGTYDGYSCTVAFTQLGTKRRMGEGEVSAFDKDTIKPLGGGGQHFTARPKMVQSPPLLEAGMVEIACARHPWQKAWLCVWDSPYVVVVPGHHDPEQVGKFTIDGVPVGRHTLEVWHPDLEPAAGTAEIEVRENETSEVKIEFKWPR